MNTTDYDSLCASIEAEFAIPKLMPCPTMHPETHMVPYDSMTLEQLERAELQSRQQARQCVANCVASRDSNLAAAKELEDAKTWVFMYRKAIAERNS